MQLSYSHAPAAGYPGMIADSGDRHVVSRVNPAVIIPYGLGVTKGTSDDHVKLPTSAAEVGKLQGIALEDQASEQIPGSDAPAHPLNSAVPVLRQGRVWVKAEVAVTAGDPVYCRWNDGNSGRTQKGAFGNSADQVSAADTATLVPGARWETSASAGAIAQIHINMP